MRGVAKKEADGKKQGPRRAESRKRRQRRMANFEMMTKDCCGMPPGLDICSIGGEGKWEKITIYSAAEESACPLDWGEQFAVQKVQPGQEMKLVTAGGQKIEHFGARRVEFSAENVEGKMKKMDLGFQVCGVKKPLAVVWRICESGNIVQFGPTDEDCFIVDQQSGDKVFMRREGGSYVLDMKFERVFQRRGAYRL